MFLPFVKLFWPSHQELVPQNLIIELLKVSDPSRYKAAPAFFVELPTLGYTFDGLMVDANVI